MRVSGWLGCALLAAACAQPPTQASYPPGTFLLRIRNYTFDPQHLTVTPGATIVVVNDDPFDHTVTSEAAPGSFAPGAVNGVSFDTGPFQGARQIDIPADAPVGTVVPYFCEMHGAAMTDAPDITIAAAPPSPVR
jgi:plastocyanin